MKNNAGIALIIATIVLTVTSFLGVMVAALFSSKTASTAYHLSSVRAQFIADGGLERGIYLYKADCAGYAGESNVALGGGQFTITLSSNAFGGSPALTASQKNIRSTATIAGATRAVEQIATCPGGTPEMRTTGQITNNGTVHCGAQTCTQAMIDAGTCNCTQETNPTLNPVSVPSALKTGQHGPTNDLSCQPISSNTSWDSGTYYCPSLTINSGVTITLTGPVTIYVDTFSINSGDNLNTSGQAANLLVLVTSGVNFNGGASMNGYLYAPTLNLTINGNLTGALAAASITMNGGSVFTWNSTAGTGTPGYSTLTGGGASETYVYWRELSP